MPPGGETADGQKYARRVLQHKIRSIRKLYGTYVGKRTIVWYTYLGKRNQTKHTAPWEKSTKSTYKCEKKKSP